MVKIKPATFRDIFNQHIDGHLLHVELKLEEIGASVSPVTDPMTELLSLYREFLSTFSIRDINKYLTGGPDAVVTTSYEADTVQYVAELLESRLDFEYNGNDSATIIVQGNVYSKNDTTIEDIVLTVTPKYNDYNNLTKETNYKLPKYSAMILTNKAVSDNISTQMLQYLRLAENTHVVKDDIATIVKDANTVISYLNNHITEIAAVNEITNRDNSIASVIWIGMSAAPILITGYEEENPLFYSGEEIISDTTAKGLLTTIEDSFKLLYLDIERIAPNLSETIKHKENLDLPLNNNDELEYLAAIRYLSEISRRMYDKVNNKAYLTQISELLIRLSNDIEDFRLAMEFSDESEVLKGVGLIQALFKKAQTNADIGFAPTPDLVRAVISGAVLSQDASKKDIIELNSYMRYIAPRLLKVMVGEPLKTSEQVLSPYYEVIERPQEVSTAPVKEQWATTATPSAPTAPSVEKHMERKGAELYSVIKWHLVKLKERKLYVNGKYELIDTILEQNNRPETLQRFLQQCANGLSYFTESTPEYIKAIGNPATDIMYMANFVPTNYEAILARDFIEELVIASEIEYDKQASLTEEINAEAELVEVNTLRGVLFDELMKCGTQDRIVTTDGAKEYARDIVGDSRFFIKIQDAIAVLTEEGISVPSFIDDIVIKDITYFDQRELTKFEKLDVSDFVRKMTDFARSVIEKEEALIDASQHLREAIEAHINVASLLELEVEVHGQFKESLKQMVMDLETVHSRIPTIKAIAYSELEWIKSKDVVKIFMELEQLDAFLGNTDYPSLIQFRTETTYSDITYFVKAHMSDLPSFFKLMNEEYSKEKDYRAAIRKTLKMVYQDVRLYPEPDLVTLSFNPNEDRFIDCTKKNELEKLTLSQIEKLSGIKLEEFIASKVDISEKTIEEHLTEMMMAGELGSYKEIKYGFYEHKSHREVMNMFNNAFPDLADDLPPFVVEFLSGERERFLDEVDKSAVVFYIIHVINKQYDSNEEETLDRILIDEQDVIAKDVIDYLFDNASMLPNFTQFLSRQSKDWEMSREELVDTLRLLFEGVGGADKETVLEEYLDNGKISLVVETSVHELQRCVSLIESISTFKVNKLDSNVLETAEEIKSSQVDLDHSSVEMRTQFGELQEDESLPVEPKFDILLHQLRKLDLLHKPYQPMKIEYMRGFYKRVAETLSTLTTYDTMPGNIVKQWSSTSTPEGVNEMSPSESYAVVQNFAYNLNPVSAFEGAFKGTYTKHMIHTFNALREADKGSIPQYTVQAFKSFGDISLSLEYDNELVTAVATDLGTVYLGEAIAYLFTVAYKEEQYFDSYKEDFVEVVKVLSKHIGELNLQDVNLNDIYQIVAKELPEIAGKLTTTNQ